MPRKPIKITNLYNLYKNNIRCEDLQIKAASVIEYTHPKCGHKYTTTMALFCQRQQFDFCTSCVKKDKDFLGKIPEQYRDNIVFIDDVNVLGFGAKIEYTNPKCLHKSTSTLTGLIQRKQLDRCSKCINKTVDDYLEKIPQQYHQCFIVKPTTSTGIVKFKHPGCDHVTEVSFHAFSKRQYFDYCNECGHKKNIVSIQHYFDQIPEKYHDCISVIGDWLGYSTRIRYVHPECGHHTETIIGTFINRVSFDICLDCFVPNVLTKEDIIKNLSFISDIEIEDVKIDQNIFVTGKCKKCGREISGKYCNLRSYHKRYNTEQCKHCCPKSFYQQELCDFISSIYTGSIKYDDRETIKVNGKQSELDVFVPDKNFAIEYNGIVWHSDKYKSKEYHYNKTKACIEKNITLLHVWDDLYLGKKEIYHSIIRNKLGLIDNKIYARKTDVKELTKEQMKSFFANNHLDGNVGSITGFGLFHDNTLLQAMSIRKVNKQNKKYSGYLEIARSATKLNCIVVGGESKLLSRIEVYAKHNAYNGILNYVSCEFGGFPKPKWKFKYEGVTGISYFYTDTHKRIARQVLQKRKPGQSERELVEELGLLRIDACPNLTYTLEL